MGGAAGHLCHLHENWWLTFGELKDVLSQAAEGRLENATEKLDGMNIMFTWSVLKGRLFVARNVSDVRNGGMDAQLLAQKFRGRGGVEEAFNSAYRVLLDAISSLPEDVLHHTFGMNGELYYSAEVIYAADPNVINYDTNNLVFHGHPVIYRATCKEINDDGRVELLSRYIDQMQRAVSMRDWRIRGPSLLQLQKIADGTIIDQALAQLDLVQRQHNLTDEHSLQDYIRSCFLIDLRSVSLPTSIVPLLLDRLTGAIGSPTVTDIKRHLAPSQKQLIADMVKDAPERIKQFMAPIESIIMQLSIEVLKGLQSQLVNDSNAEIQRLRSQVTRAIDVINRSGNDAAMNVLQREMTRLKHIENISSSMEGIVFKYKGKMYKFTGAFAPAHQILALFKYGRKGIPKMSEEQ